MWPSCISRNGDKLLYGIMLRGQIVHIRAMRGHVAVDLSCCDIGLGNLVTVLQPTCFQPTCVL